MFEPEYRNYPAWEKISTETISTPQERGLTMGEVPFEAARVRGDKVKPFLGKSDSGSILGCKCSQRFCQSARIWLVWVWYGGATILIPNCFQR